MGDRVEDWAIGDRVAVGWFGGNCGHTRAAGHRASPRPPTPSSASLSGSSSSTPLCSAARA
ncbi:hypothetical protein ACWCQQ_38565 [Streptomyces sp. NPDC002143]